ncbi:MAG TPA: HEAT repeat domain-containing protein, partial [Candidatus Acidoferrales bacterium]|nr:HEAT repeat domain-containing protein [Candidatus Acidoferrales bacterium]
MKGQRALILISFWFVVLSCAAWAQKPNVTNAKITELSAAQGLKQAIAPILSQQQGPLWIGYKIPADAKERSMCCWNSLSDAKASGKSCCLGCRMDSDGGSSFSGTDSNCTPPEPVPYAFVLLRAEDKQISKVRVFSADCPLDFAGLPLYWLHDVKPGESIALLMGMVSPADSDRDDDKKLTNQAVMAIAMHDVSAADQTLEKLIQPNQPGRLREKVAFWAGVERGKAGYVLLHKYVVNDQDDRFREKGTFALSQSHEPGAIQDLIGMARHDVSSRVRGQAIFWLAQIGGRKEAAQITDAIENDPDTEVKKRAVFALSQLHDG